MLHDIPLGNLVCGKDRDIIKAITRGETAVTKVLNKTTTVNPVHVLVSSNQVSIS
jgi:hypothetical protein